MSDPSTAHTRIEADEAPPPSRVSIGTRLRVAASLLAGLRKPDFQAAGTFMRLRFGDSPIPVQWLRFFAWSMHQMFVEIPEGMRNMTFDARVSRTPMWLIDANPHADHPWANDPGAELPGEADTVVVGAGFTGAAVAYHWSKQAPQDRLLVVLEMDDPASGSSGRNEGLVVMGRYFRMVRDTVRNHLPAARPDLAPDQRERLARQFASAYCDAAYKNAEMIERTIREEGFDCDYTRAGWVQAAPAGEEASTLAESVRLARESGYADWTSIEPKEVLERSGMRVGGKAGFSRAAASWHPAKWVWCLLASALRRPTVRLYTRTRVERVDDRGDHYVVHTSRGMIRARHYVSATESYTPHLHPRFHGVITPEQEQAASGDGGPMEMKPHVGISGSWMFAGRYGRRVLFGSGGSRVPDHEAGRNRPSRFLTRFLAKQIELFYGPFRLHVRNEWSGTVGYTPDQYPIVGLVDGKRHYIVGGMCGSGSGISFNGGRCMVNRILGKTDEDDDYPPAYFAPSRLLDPANHRWPDVSPGD